LLPFRSGQSEAAALGLNLVGERTRIVNRLKSGLVRLGIRGFNPKLRKAPERLAALRTPEGASVPPNTLNELKPCSTIHRERGNKFRVSMATGWMIRRKRKVNAGMYA
jgi:hypothetical protein